MGRAYLPAGLAAFLLLAPGCTGTRASRDAAGPGQGPGILAAHRADFHDRFLLSGELKAVRSDDIVVPRTPSWQIQIRWMENDGAFVKAGQKVLEFDNSSFTGQLEEKRLARTEAGNALAQQRAQSAATEAERVYDLEAKKTELDKAKIEAAVPPDLRSGRDYQEKQLAQRRAESAYENAREALTSFRDATKEDLAVKRIELDKAEREIQTAEGAIGALSLTAPRNGILVVNTHPWEGRKFAVGDSAYVGLAVMSIPDLTEMQVEAYLMDVDDGRISAGMPATCTLDTYPDQTFQGTVKEISAIAQEMDRNSQRRAFRATIALEHSDAELMRPGMSVKVEIDKGTIENALLAPRAGLDLTGAEPKALLENGTDVKVRLGACGALECVVLEGLEAGALLRSGG